MPELQVIDPETLRKQPGVTAVDPTHVLIETASVGLTGYQADDWLRDERQIDTSYYRLRGYPLTADLAAFIDAHQRIYVIEQNRDAQLLQLMRLDLTPERISKLRSVLHYNGLPLDARSVTDDVLSQEGFEVAKKTVSRMSAGSAGGE